VTPEDQEQSVCIAEYYRSDTVCYPAMRVTVGLMSQEGVRRSSRRFQLAVFVVSDVNTLNCFQCLTTQSKLNCLASEVRSGGRMIRVPWYTMIDESS
jgi:hypothetical protein